MKNLDYFKIPKIIIRKLYQELSQYEEVLLDDWLNNSSENVQLFKQLEQKSKFYEKYKSYNKIKDDFAWKEINRKIQTASTVKSIPLHIRLLKYAAVLLLPIIIASVVYYIYDVNRSYTLAEIRLEENPLNLSEATIVLSNGRLLNLKETNPDTLAELSGARMLKNIQTLSFNENYKKDLTIENEQITLVVPRSRVQRTILPDGSVVWVNASSSIQHPVQFSDSIRKVHLIGEAYFQVVKNPNKPFMVSVDGMEITVKGTSFNVTAYKTDDFVETTLVEGSVVVNTKNYKVVLEPGEQAQLKTKNDSLIKRKVNTNLYTSWKDGKFIFDYETLEKIVKKLARWYNVEAFYDKDSFKKLHFSGTLNKYDEIEKTLHIIEIATNIEFEITKTTILIKEKSKK